MPSRKPRRQKVELERDQRTLSRNIPSSDARFTNTYSNVLSATSKSFYPFPLLETISKTMSGNYKEASFLKVL